MKNYIPRNWTGYCLVATFFAYYFLYMLHISAPIRQYLRSSEPAVLSAPMSIEEIIISKTNRTIQCHMG